MAPTICSPKPILKKGNLHIPHADKTTNKNLFILFIKFNDDYKFDLALFNLRNDVFWKKFQP